MADVAIAERRRDSSIEDLLRELAPHSMRTNAWRRISGSQRCVPICPSWREMQPRRASTTAWRLAVRRAAKSSVISKRARRASLLERRETSARSTAAIEHRLWRVVFALVEQLHRNGCPIRLSRVRMRICGQVAHRSIVIALPERYSLVCDSRAKARRRVIQARCTARGSAASMPPTN